MAAGQGVSGTRWWPARMVLCAHYHLYNRPKLEGMLKWWPVDLESTGPEQKDRGADKSKRKTTCSRLPYPVVVEKRHLPNGERSRFETDLGL